MQVECIAAYGPVITVRFGHVPLALNGFVLLIEKTCVQLNGNAALKKLVRGRNR